MKIEVEKFIVDSVNASIYNTLLINADYLLDHDFDKLATAYRWMAKTKRHPYWTDRGFQWHLMKYEENNVNFLMHYSTIIVDKVIEDSIPRGSDKKQCWTIPRWHRESVSEAFLWAAEKLIPIEVIDDQF